MQSVSVLVMIIMFEMLINSKNIYKYFIYL